MPLKVTRLWISCLVLTAAAGSSTTALAQQAENQMSSGGMASAITTNTVADTAQQKIAKVRALIAARNFGGAIYELEKIKKESSDEALQSVSRVMLMSVYLEQPDYNRAQALLEDSFNTAQNKKSGADIYLAVAGQVIKSSQNQLERYKRLGINIADANLPAEMTNDLGKWQSLLELIVTESKQMSLESAKKSKQPAESLALLEAAATARGTLARDDYETARWRNEMNDTRELMASAQTKVEEVDASVQTPVMPGTLVASTITPATVFNQPAEQPKPVAPLASSQSQSNNQNTALNQTLPAVEKKTEPTTNNPVQKNETVAQQPQKPVTRERVAASSNSSQNNAVAEKKAENNESQPTYEKTSAKTDSPANGVMPVGSLTERATSKVPPVYPAIAKTARVTGVVKVEVVVNESGEVTDIKGANGPQMLQRAAIDAVRRWKFKPYTHEGQPVRTSGFVNFNFTL